MKRILEGKKVKASNTISDGKSVSGTVQLIYDEAIATGTGRDYVTVTHILIKEEDSELCHEIRPRDIFEIDE